ncbi:hypothetical protein CSW98_05335 [Vibrio sp. HA2012]|uniref:hypothetical protein n=1 Tax=Vibrio sp. HA2012 TaxID=1971595 RepID=UPI000C2B6C32|nr:hypothetical protein [Vibrio sp. HA2012]PJC87325.1 hypothetical protein CSW98_05335 [Vibrio sp. HA2012]
MKTTTKILTILGVLAISAGVYAHGGNGDGFGFHHGMMDEDSPQYQTMLKLHNDPQAMREWAEKMHDDPNAMIDWMKEMHANFTGNGRGFAGCHNFWSDTDDNDSNKK